MIDDGPRQNDAAARCTELSNTGLVKQHAPFGAIYLDSNVLLPSWPYQVPAATKQFLHLAHLLNIPVYLPLPVEIELEAHWQRESLATLYDAAGTVNREMPKLDTAWQAVALPEEAVLLASYRSLCAARKVEHQLKTTPFGEKAVPDFFGFATRRVFPFEKEGKNFQDAVILHAVLEHNVAEGSSPAAFISRNKKDFSASGLESLSRSLGANVQYFGTEAALEQELDKAVRGIVVVVWTETQQLAKDAIEQEAGILERFLQKKFLRASDIQLRLKGIHDVKVFLLDKAEAEKIPMSFLADVEFTTGIKDAAPLMLDRTVMVTGDGQLQQGTFAVVSFDSAELT